MSAHKLTRAQAMQDRIVLESVKVAEVEQEALKNHLAYTYMDGIDRFMYDASRGVGRMFEYARPSVKEAQEVLRHRWAGGNYSSRVWGNAKYMSKSLESALMENMLAGKPGKETWEELVKAAGGVVQHAQRLIRTETAYVAGQAEKQGYERAGFAEYKFVARLEAITCPVCGKLDGQLFPVRDAVAGKNLPPIHPWCRCTTMPWDKAVEAAMNDSDTRWARDPKTGKVVEVPMSMTYTEWKEGKAQHDSKQIVKQDEFNSLSDYDNELKRLREKRSRLLAKDNYNKAETDELLNKIFALEDQRKDYATAYNFANGDPDLVYMLRSGNPTEVCTAVNKILDGEQYGLPQSKWSGVVRLATRATMPDAWGRKEWNCDITIRDDAEGNIKVYIHELLHARSVSLYDKSEIQALFSRVRPAEEGSVEYLTQEICKKANIPYFETYEKYVGALKEIKGIVAHKEKDFDFAKKVFAFPAKTRYI